MPYSLYTRLVYNWCHWTCLLQRVARLSVRRCCFSAMDCSIENNCQPYAKIYVLETGDFVDWTAAIEKMVSGTIPWCRWQQSIHSLPSWRPNDWNFLGVQDVRGVVFINNLVSASRYFCPPYVLLCISFGFSLVVSSVERLIDPKPGISNSGQRTRTRVPLTATQHVNSTSIFSPSLLKQQTSL